MQKKPSPCIIALFMKEKYGTKIFSADKITLFGIFIAGLFIARFVTTLHSAILLSEPIKLDYAGLSVSMPAGNGWKSENQWKYEENSFTLSSVLFTGRRTSIASADCQYLPAAAGTTTDALFQQRADKIGGVIAKTGQTPVGTLTFDWARITTQKTPAAEFFGTAQLPDNRQFDIEVRQIAGETDLAEQVFRRIAASLILKDSQSLQAGGKIVSEIKSEGLGSFLHNQNQQSFFLIKDSAGLVFGFTMDIIIDSGPHPSAAGEPVADGNKLNIQAAGLSYIKGRYAAEQVTFFQGDNSFDEFDYKIETKSASGRNDVTISSGAETILGRDGILTVRKFEPQQEEKSYRLSSAAIPDVFLDQLYERMIDDNYKKIIVDIIEPDGKITPALVSKNDSEAISGAAGSAGSTPDKKPAYALRMELLDGRGFFEEVSFDDNKQISKRLLHHKETYAFERTTSEEVLKQFPEQAEYILHKIVVNP